MHHKEASGFILTRNLLLFVNVPSSASGSSNRRNDIADRMA